MKTKTTIEALKFAITTLKLKSAEFDVNSVEFTYDDSEILTQDSLLLKNEIEDRKLSIKLLEAELESFKKAKTKKLRKTSYDITSLVDFYKIDHINQNPKKLNYLYSNFTPRSSKFFNGSSMYDNKVVNFGLSMTIKDLLINKWNKKFFNKKKSKVITRYKRRMANAIGDVRTDQWEALHDLGYLPLLIKALPEGSRSPIKVPVFTITCTDENFGWLVNYIESSLSADSWKKITIATVAFEFRRVFEKYSELTGSNRDFIRFQGHDFSMRGLGHHSEAYYNSPAHLTSFIGTDTIAVIDSVERFYKADSDTELIGSSIFASEHAVITMSISNYINQHSREGYLATFGVTLDIIKKAFDNEYKFIQNNKKFYKIISSIKIKEVSEEYYRDRISMSMKSLKNKQIAEYEVLKYILTEVYPTGMYSHVSDSYDYWHLITCTLPKLKDIINSRKVNNVGMSKLVIRPDSGEPIKIICGLKIQELIIEENDHQVLFKSKKEINNYANNHLNTVINDGYKYKNKYYSFDGIKIEEFKVKGTLQLLWEIFGGTRNKKGFKVINSKIGMIYGDSITVVKQEKILEEMMVQGFASENIVLGIGSYSYQFLTRDTLGFAIKATSAVIDNNLLEVFKDPKTDSGIKKSARGLLKVSLDKNNDYYLEDRVSLNEETEGELQQVFCNGVQYNAPSLQEIRDRIDNEFRI